MILHLGKLWTVAAWLLELTSLLLIPKEGESFDQIILLTENLMWGKKYQCQCISFFQSYSASFTTNCQITLGLCSLCGSEVSIFLPCGCFWIYKMFFFKAQHI